MVEKTDLAIVTGANAGIGKELTAGLMERGCHVVMACRRLDRCEEAKNELGQRGLPGSCECRRLDLADFTSVRHFAVDTRQRLRQDKQDINLLINNAGVIGVPPVQGEDQQLRINHLGPFLLTRLLTPALVPGGRVINVASRAHKQGSLHIIDGKIQGTPSHWYGQYARSKLCNVLHALELQRRFAAEGTAITAHAVSPGRVNTGIFDNLPPLAKSLLKPLASALFQTPKQGASTVLYAATAPEVKARNMLYLHNMREARASQLAQDPHLAQQLWDASSAAVGWSSEDEQA
ncbi:g5071 [Coccomyxa elongata]